MFTRKAVITSTRWAARHMLKVRSSSAKPRDLRYLVGLQQDAKVTGFVQSAMNEKSMVREVKKQRQEDDNEEATLEDALVKREDWIKGVTKDTSIDHHPKVHVAEIVKKKFDMEFAEIRKQESKAAQKTWNRMSKLERLIGMTGEDFEVIKRKSPRLMTLDVSKVIQPRLRNLTLQFPKCSISKIVRRAPRLLELEMKQLNERKRILHKALPMDIHDFNKMLERQPMILQNRFEKTTRIKIWWIKQHAWDWDFEEGLKETPWILKLGWGKLGRLAFFLEYAKELEARFVEYKADNDSKPPDARQDRRGMPTKLADSINIRAKCFSNYFPMYKDFLIRRMEHITKADEMNPIAARKHWDGEKTKVMEEVHGDWLQKKAESSFRAEFKTPMSELNSKFEI